MGAETLWQSIVEDLRSQTSESTFDRWLKPTRGIEVLNGVLVVGASGPRARLWLERRAGYVRRLLATRPGRVVDVRFEIIRARSPEPRVRKLFADHAPFHPRYTFDTFVTGPSNRMAGKAAREIALRPGAKYNPLFIYGGVGLGKTHLLHAIGSAIEHEAPWLRVVYTTTDQFMNDMIRGVREGALEEFRGHYREADVLLMDDLQSLIGKESTQEEFFHTFNDLRDNGAQIVLACDRPAKVLYPVEERLVSRFQWGLIVDVQPPTFNERTEILQSKARQKGWPIGPSVITYLARRIPGNVRELEGSLNHIVARAQVMTRRIDVELATEVLDELERHPEPYLGLDVVLRVVADYFQLNVADLVGRGRVGLAVTARHVAMYLAREELGVSLPEIGRSMGKRDHSTVLYGCTRVSQAMTTDPEMRVHVDAIRARLSRQQARDKAMVGTR